MNKVYRISEIGCDDLDVTGKLCEAGIVTTENLLFRLSSSGEAGALAQVTGLRTETLREFHRRARLMITTRAELHWVKLLEAAGVATVDDLSHSDPNNLVRQLARACTGAAPSERPALDTVRWWIEQARQSVGDHRVPVGGKKEGASGGGPSVSTGVAPAVDAIQQDTPPLPHAFNC